MKKYMLNGEIADFAEENATKTLEMTDALVTNVPCYLLKCDISKQAMQTSYEEMTGKKYEK